MPYRVEGIPPPRLAEYWPIVAPMLAPALERGGDMATLDDVFDYIHTERCALWSVWEDDDLVAALVMHLPSDRDALMVWLMGGRDFEAWHHVVQPLLQRFAREAGRTYVEAYARPGLAKILRSDGWRQRHTLVAIAA